MKTIPHPNDGHQIKVLSACMYTQESEAISTSSETYGDRLGFERGLQSIARRENARVVFFEICEAADQVNLNVSPAATPQTDRRDRVPYGYATVVWICLHDEGTIKAVGVTQLTPIGAIEPEIEPLHVRLSVAQDVAAVRVEGVKWVHVDVDPTLPA